MDQHFTSVCLLRIKLCYFKFSDQHFGFKHDWVNNFIFFLVIYSINFLKSVFSLKKFRAVVSFSLNIINGIIKLLIINRRISDDN